MGTGTHIDLWVSTGTKNISPKSVGYHTILIMCREVLKKDYSTFRTDITVTL